MRAFLTKRTCAIGVVISLCCVWYQMAAGQGTVSLPHEKDGLEKKIGANGERGIVELVESIPIETSLDLPGLRNTPEVWLQMIDSARNTIDIETFYFSAGPGENRFELILKALENASRRGVRVRMLSDARFHKTYPEVFERFGQLPNTETRIIDAGGLWDGVVHAKFFIVDGEELFVGSQNWDWRALEHIHELGVRIRHADLAFALETVFLMDWERSVGEQAPGDSPGKREDVSMKSGIGGPFLLETESEDTTKVILAASPNQALPEGIAWDEPLLQQAIDDARARIRLHLLTFMPVDRAGRYHETLENALKRAAARGVTVQIILSNWSKRGHILPYVLSLAAVPRIDIRFSNIPEWSGGFIPYARVEHPKYMIADDDVCWIGTSNWTRGGFLQSRNISLFFHGKEVAAHAGAFFDGSWNSEYVEEVDLCGTYTPPRIGPG